MTHPPALTTPAHPVTLEQRRDLWHSKQTRLEEERREQAEALFDGFPAWQGLYRGGLRDYLTWFNYGDYNGKFYTAFYAGAALNKGFTGPELGHGDLALIGQALLEGALLKDVQAAYQTGGIEAVRLLRGKKAVTTVQIPASESEAVREVVAQVSQSDNLPAPEAAARIVLAFGELDPALQQAALHQHATGQNVLDALIEAVDQRRDYRSALAAQGCLMCGQTPVELHHMRLWHDDRNRTQTVLAPLCTRHHIARPGDSTDAIHAQRLDDLPLEFFKRGWEALARAAEQTRPQEGHHDD